MTVIKQNDIVFHLSFFCFDWHCETVKWCKEKINIKIKCKTWRRREKSHYTHFAKPKHFNFSRIRFIRLNVLQKWTRLFHLFFFFLFQYFVGLFCHICVHTCTSNKHEIVILISSFACTCKSPANVFVPHTMETGLSIHHSVWVSMSLTMHCWYSSFSSIVSMTNCAEIHRSRLRYRQHRPNQLVDVLTTSMMTMNPMNESMNRMTIVLCENLFPNPMVSVDLYRTTANEQMNFWTLDQRSLMAN